MSIRVDSMTAVVAVYSSELQAVLHADSAEYTQQCFCWVLQQYYCFFCRQLISSMYYELRTGCCVRIYVCIRIMCVPTVRVILQAVL